MKTMKLGELISALERKNQGVRVIFDFVYFRPEGIHSWRGDYSLLALGYTNSFPGEMKVSGLLLILRDAVGKEFTGWKGGKFIMDHDTEVWVSNDSEASSTAIVDVADVGHNVVLRTALLDD